MPAYKKEKRDRFESSVAELTSYVPATIDVRPYVQAVLRTYPDASRSKLFFLGFLSVCKDKSIDVVLPNEAFAAALSHFFPSLSFDFFSVLMRTYGRHFKPNEHSNMVKFKKLLLASANHQIRQKLSTAKSSFDPVDDLSPLVKQFYEQKVSAAIKLEDRLKLACVSTDTLKSELTEFLLLQENSMSEMPFSLDGGYDDVDGVDGDLFLPPSLETVSWDTA